MPGDGERKKRERARYQVCLGWGQRREGERAEFQLWLGREGGFLCALFRAEVLTEGP